MDYRRVTITHNNKKKTYTFPIFCQAMEKFNKVGFRKNFIVEPNIKQLPDEFSSSFYELTTVEKALKSSQIIVLLVDHSQFKNINLNLLSGKKIIDTRGIWSNV